MGFVALLWRERQWVTAAAQRGGAIAAGRHTRLPTPPSAEGSWPQTARQAAVSTVRAKYTAAREQATGAVREADRRWKARRNELSQTVARWSRLGRSRS
ncbi:hypothetical protein N865_20205 [Intrasporangium oryzae NRRL B-24470]|uniref:Uncharacterized protein n=1 Tax=Intrasporangium oryzae NRRL B-24470 TaxID=1386089 RepID=W9GB29_9MICO|nr:hypothetical protein [Intrasporangium oryzae]EWT02008.1 hypothetical protein N865_20205 [Intrasporangium oryzae NRRL B-24470]